MDIQTDRLQPDWQMQMGKYILNNTTRQQNGKEHMQVEEATEHS